MRLALLAATLTAGVVTAPAYGQSSGISYDCDTASGHFSELRLPAHPGNFTVQGTVVVRQIAEIGEYAPVTRLAVSGSSASSGQAPDDIAGFALGVMPASVVDADAKEGLIQYVRWDDRRDGRDRSHQPFAAEAAPKELSFRLDYDGRSVSVEIGGQRQLLPFTAETRSFASSVRQVNFSTATW